MRPALIFNQCDFGEFCRAKAVELAPIVGGGMRCRVKLMLDAHAKLDVRALSNLRHKLNAILHGEGALVLPEEPRLEYRGVRVVDAKPWDDLFETGTAIVTFETQDDAAYGDERTTTASDIEVCGTYKTYPVVEMEAEAGDAIMVLHLDSERFVNIVHAFKGGELVVMDFEHESVTIDGEDAACDIGLYSDFFSLAPGMNHLAFAGCTSHVTRYSERWL